MPADTDRSRPIVILGVSRRSGTNFLASLLLCHHDCSAPRAPLAEDHLLVEAHLLERYVARTARHWPRRWGDREQGAQELREALGTGLLEFLADPTPGRRTVTRTPTTANLHLAPSLYHGADIIVLVRDGRSVAASFAEAWGWPLDRATLEWRRGARNAVALVRDPPEGARLLFLRYEDVLSDLDEWVTRLLDFTGLDETRFDRSRARRLPVLGSSFTRDERGRITWEPRPATPDFDPARRYASWSPQQLARFDWLAGPELRALGYAIGEPAHHDLSARVRMRLLDAIRPIREAPWTAKRFMVRELRSARIEWRSRQPSVSSTDVATVGTSSSTSRETPCSSTSARKRSSHTR